MKTNEFQLKKLFAGLRWGVLLSFGAAIALSLGACDKEDDEPEPEPTPDPVYFPTEQDFTVYAGESQSLTFTINYDWTLDSDAQWCTIDGQTSVSGVAGDATVTVEVSDLDQDKEASKATLTLTANGETAVLSVITRPAPDPVVFPEEQDFTVAAGETQSITFTINYDWTLDSDAQWCTINGETSVSGEAGEATITVEVSDLDQDTEDSTATLTLTANGETAVLSVITRPAPEPVSFPEEQDFTVSAGETQSITFTINYDWTLESDAQWCTINGETSVSGEAGDATITVEVSDLDQDLLEDSKATLTLTSNGETAVLSVITRPAPGAQITVSDSAGNEVEAFEAGWDDYKNYTIATNFDYSLTSTQPTWLQINGTVSGTAGSSTSVGFKAADDPSVYKYPQTGELTLANSDGSVTYTYDVTFAGMDDDVIEITRPTSSYEGWEVSTDGTTFTQDGTEHDPTFTLVALNDDYVLVAVDDEDGVLGDSGYVHFTDDKTGGVTVTVDDLGEGSTRSAGVYAFPAAVYETVKDNLSANLDAKYALMHFTQNEAASEEDDGEPFVVVLESDYTEQTLSDSYSGSYKTQVATIESTYNPVAIKYFKPLYASNGSKNYIVAPKPLKTSNEWGGTATLLGSDGNALNVMDKPVVVNNKEYVKDGVSYPATSVYFPYSFYTLACLVFTDDNGNNYVLVFYFY